MMRISLFGLGYVGTVCAACLARAGHTVVGVDVNSAKVESINSGVSPIIEPGIEDLIKQGLKSKKLRATTSSTEAIMSTDVSLVCVGTPGEINGRQSLSYVTRVCEQIGTGLRSKSSPHSVVIRSTMLPGSTEQCAIPRLEACSGRNLGHALKVFYNPEFLREGSSVYDFHHPAKIVIGTNNGDLGQEVARMYHGMKAPVIRTSIRAAEMVKYADNAFHALKVTFANEIGNLCKNLAIDGHEVMSIFCSDSKLNISTAYLKPGFAFGGSCLPKDLRALLYQGRRLDLEMPLLNAILESNSLQIKLAIQKIISMDKKRVGILGMSFKQGTDDLRESPLVELIETLVGKGYNVRIYDRNVSVKRLVGANRLYVEEHLPHLSSLMVDSVEALIEQCDVLVIGHRSLECLSALERLPADKYILDLVRITDDPNCLPNYEGINW